MFRVNGEYWAVILVPPGSPELKRPNGNITVGCCDNDLKRIFIDNSLDKDFFKKVLCHEITHAAMFSYDVYLTIDQEELIANILATYGQEIINITNRAFQKIKGDYN